MWQTCLTQTSSWVMTTSPSWQAACRAVRACGEALTSGALICSLLLWARSSRRRGRSLSTTALSSQSDMEPALSSVWAVKGATKTRCSYLARIHVSLSSLTTVQQQLFIITIIFTFTGFYSPTSNNYQCH